MNYIPVSERPEYKKWFPENQSKKTWLEKYGWLCFILGLILVGLYAVLSDNSIPCDPYDYRCQESFEGRTYDQEDLRYMR